MMRWRCGLAGLVLQALLALHVSATLAGDALPLAQDPALEARMLRLAEELRCLVCQNQTVADSHAGLANDLKAQIREQLAAGRSDAQIRAYMVERYGDFVLYRPPVKPTTALLWYGPFGLLALGAGWGVILVRRRQPRDGGPVPTEAQRQHAAALLDG